MPRPARWTLGIVAVSLLMAAIGWWCRATLFGPEVQNGSRSADWPPPAKDGPTAIPTRGPKVPVPDPQPGISGGSAASSGSATPGTFDTSKPGNPMDPAYWPDRETYFAYLRSIGAMDTEKLAKRVRTREQQIRAFQESFLSDPTPENEKDLRDLIAAFSGTPGGVQLDEVFTPQIHEEIARAKEDLRRKADSIVTDTLAQAVPEKEAEFGRAMGGITNILLKWEAFPDIAESVEERVWAAYETISHPYARSQIVRTLDNDPRPIALDRALGVLKNDPDAQVRMSAARSLGRTLRGERAVQGLVEAMRNDPSDAVRADATRLLVEYAESARLRRLPDYGALQSALAAGVLPDPDDPASLVRALDPGKADDLSRIKQFARLDPDSRVRCAAIRRLATQPGPTSDVVETVSGALSGDKDAGVREEAAHTLGVAEFLRLPEVQTALRRAAESDPDPDVVSECKRMLAHLAQESGDR